MENVINSTTSSTLPNNINYTPKQLKLPLILEEIISANDPVHTLEDFTKGFDLKKYLVSKREDTRGCTGYNPVTLLKVVLFAFMLRGYASTREIADLCRNDIRFRYLLSNERKFPSHMTISNFINNYLKEGIETIFKDFNNHLVKIENIDLEHVYIDGTKIEANANKYSWVWKKACLTNRDKLFKKITILLNNINKDSIYQGIKYENREIYEIAYVESIFNTFVTQSNINTNDFVTGKGIRKSKEQRYYELLKEYLDKLKEYSYKIETCGESRNSYSKTDKDATFMRIKTDYMGNDQLLPAYNIQVGISDEYISVIDVNQYASDSDCFIPLMEEFKNIYDIYPTYPIGDAGYGTYNNYLYCEEKGMKKYIKFSMFKKETQDDNYHNDPYRVQNFKKDNEGNLICPNNKKFIKVGDRPVKNNKYGRTEELYQCEDCNNCEFKSKCTKSKDNRIVNLNEELTSFHKEVIVNLESIQGCLLRMNRSIQAEGAFGIIKQDRLYRRIVRKGLESVKMELYMIAIGYNFYKYHNKIQKRKLA